MNIEEIDKEIKESILAKNRMDAKSILKATEIILNAYKKNKKTIWFGNGGSAADAQHIVAEFVGRFEKERKPLSAISLNTNTSNITAIANDYSYSDVFSRSLEAVGEEGDVVVGISTSGTSKNVLNGLEKAKEIGCKTIGLVGGNTDQIKDLCDVSISIPIKRTCRVQEIHILTGHIICFMVEKELFGE